MYFNMIKNSADVIRDVHDVRSSKNSACRFVVNGAREICISWEPAVTKSGFQLRYQLFESTYVTLKTGTCK